MNLTIRLCTFLHYRSWCNAARWMALLHLRCLSLHGHLKVEASRWVQVSSTGMVAPSHVLTAVAGTGWRLTWQLHQETREADCIPQGSQGMHEQTERRSRRSLCVLSVGSRVVSHDGAVWFERVLKIIRCSLSAEHFSFWINRLKSSTLHPTARRRRPLPLVLAAAVRVDGAALLPRFSFLSVTSLIVVHCTLCREQNRTLDGSISGKAVALLTCVARCSLLSGRMFIAVKWPPISSQRHGGDLQRKMHQSGICLLTLMTNRLPWKR